MINGRKRAPAALGVIVLPFVVACGSNDEDKRADFVAGRNSPCPVVTRGGGCRPAGPDETVAIASGGLLLPAAGFPIGSEGFFAFSVRWTDARIMSIKSSHSWAFETAAPLAWEGAEGATGVTVRGDHVLYFMGASGGVPSLHVAKLSDDRLDEAAAVVLDGASGVLPIWPQGVGIADGRVLLTFVDVERRVFAGVDDGTGLSFHVSEVPLALKDALGVLAYVGTTARGSWVLTYQIADSSWRFRSYVVLSKNQGATWTSPASLSDEDAASPFPIARVVGDADVYYAATTVVPETWFTPEKVMRTVRRRAVHEDGTLGTEQMVTSTEIGDVGYPQTRRLPDGRVALMLTLSPTPKSSSLGLIVLDGDAP